MASPSEKNEENATDIAGKAQEILETATHATEDFRQRADELAGSFKNMATNQPLSTLAVAIAIGFVLGALWKS
jgi:ElaB/YqjD/DUF883 family membrane-anchored ribosome-binding protein